MAKSPAVRPLLALRPAELRARVESLGGRPFHASVVLHEVLANGVRDYAGMTALPRALRAELAERIPILAGSELRATEAPDGTIKLLLAFDPPDPRQSGAEHAVETVWIPSRRPDRGATLCVSTQVGCPVGCPFCASGLWGLSRSLAAHEIAEQFLRGAEIGPLSRAVVMGIGEPLLNYTALRDALELVRGPLELGARRVTVSTVGFPERVRRAARSAPPFQLAISLHTPDDAQRDELVPAMRGTPIEEVLRAGDDWFEVTGREVTYEYVLLAGVNDRPAQAERLARRLSGRRCGVNLIPYNPVLETGYQRPDPYAVSEFQRTLRRHGVVATVRWSRGSQADAACGQLRIGRTGRSRSDQATG